MKNVLIPTDFSDNSWSAIKYALGFLKNTSCNFYLLHIADMGEHPVKRLSFSPISYQENTPSKKKLEGVLKSVKRLTNKAKHKTFTVLEYGSFIDAMRRMVPEKKIDLIVMGTKGASGMKKLIIGSNTGDVITKVQCNTLVIPEAVSYHKPKEVVFPTDYNIFYSNSILEVISEVLFMNSSNLRVIHVLKGNGKLSEYQQANKEYLQDYLSEVLPERNSFHTIHEKKTIKGIQNFITDRQVDLMIMVAKNLNFLQQILFDSTVEKVSFHTEVPFLVIHE
ncbi:MAG: universal stress protein [Saonia sp.]